MATTPESTKGVPRVVGNPSPTLRADHNALADWVRDNLDRLVPNNSARDAIVLKYLGMVVQTSDTNSVWLCANPAGSGTWIRMFSAPAPGTLTFPSGFTITPGFTLVLEKNGDWVDFDFAINNAAITAVASGVTICTLPVGFRPGSLTTIVGSNNSWTVTVFFVIQTNGEVKAYSTVGLGAGATMYGARRFKAVS